MFCIKGRYVEPALWGPLLQALGQPSPSQSVYWAVPLPSDRQQPLSKSSSMVIPSLSFFKRLDSLRSRSSQAQLWHI